MEALNLLDGWFKFDVGEGAFFAVFGFIFVFAGIALLILILSLIGKAMSALNDKKKKEKTAPVTENKPVPAPEANELSPEIVAVIMAAISAYETKEAEKCHFVVKRIRKI